MEWTTTNFINNSFNFLYLQNGKILAVNDDCLETLEEILNKLSSEDGSTLYAFRRTLGFGQIIRKSLIPLLLYVKDETKITNSTKIINTTIKILNNLTLPVECLLSIETMYRTDVGRHTLFEINQLLTMNREVFNESSSTKLVVDYMKNIIENNSHLSCEQCDSINDCLLLLTNILHTPDTKTRVPNCNISHLSMQNVIMWNLFTHGIDKIIIYLISCPQKIFWCVTIVQLLALMYKNQHVGRLQKLLNLWLEASYSDSSDDESNTSLPDTSRDDLSSLITSNLTSDMSDIGGNDMNKLHDTFNFVDAVHKVEKPSDDLDFIEKDKYVDTKISMNISSDKSINTNENRPLFIGRNSTGNNISSTCPFAQSEISDGGYVTHIENHESLSTSSNDDDKSVRQKLQASQKGKCCNRKCRVAAVLQKKDVRRKRLVKRKTRNRIKMRGLVQHSPTDEDIANILKEFIVDFLLKGYSTLVNDLHIQLLTNNQFKIDTSHFFWLLTYFLKFATQMELDLEYLGPVLSYEILSYLVFQAVCIYEELEIIYTIPNIDIKHCLRRLHLVVIAIKEFLQGLETYQKMIHLNDNDLNKLSILQGQIRKMQDFKVLFVLLLRQYNQNIQSKQYLQDLILTNHNFLLFLENGTEIEDQPCNMREYLAQFATVEIMRQYGLLLENFKDNGKYVNNCIFTVMHHVCGDIENVPILFQPSILKTFVQIWETDYEIFDDWSDLIEYIIHKFIDTSETYCINTINTHYANFQHYFEELDKLASSESNDKYEQHPSTTKQITKKHKRTKMRHNTGHSLKIQLLEQNIIKVSDYKHMTKNKHTEIIKKLPFNARFKQASKEYLRTDLKLDKNDIEILTEYLLKENKSMLIIWLQKWLIDVWSVKLLLNNLEEFKDKITTLEPIIYHCALLNLPIPLIPWTADLKNILEYQPFLLLLHKIGFHLPKDIGKSFAHMPNSWTAEYILSVAQKLGPVDTVEFDISNRSGGTKYDKFEVEPQNSIVSNEEGTLKESLYSKPMILSNATETACYIPSLQLNKADKMESNRGKLPTNMEYCPMHELHLVLIDDLEKNSNCDTASLASELLNLYVSDISDEEDKMIFANQKN